MLSDIRKCKWGKDLLPLGKTLIRAYPLWCLNPKKMRGNVTERGFCRFCCPWKCWFRTALGHEHLSPLTLLMVYSYVLDSLVSLELFQILVWDWRGFVSHSFWSLAFRRAKSSHATSVSAVAQPISALHRLPFISASKTDKLFKKLPQKIHVFTWLQIRLWRDLWWGWMCGCSP